MDMSPESELDLVRAASAFAALGSEQRLGVLLTLVRAGPEGLSIGVLGERCGVTGSTLTHHLRILREAGLVNQAKVGRKIICVGAAYERARALSDFLLSSCCADTAEMEHDHG
ncbi:MAG: helix-turn-helix domain-containing protein [Paracoccaceae bacterium]|nr:helix-turn-helix domain-containing protein [Paracoccaceae bacterium]